MRRTAVFLGALLLLLAATPPAEAAFSKSCTITVQASQVPSTQTNFPVLISVTNAILKTVGNGGYVTSSSGFDVRPYSDAGLTTAIADYQLYYYDGTAGTIVMWAKIASLADGSVYYLGIGDSSITTDGSTSAVWSTSWDKGMWPASRDGSTIDFNDYSPNAKNGTNHGVAAAAGQIVGAGEFTRTDDDFADVANDASLNFGFGNFSTSIWVKFKSFGTFQGLISKNTAADQGWSVYLRNDDKLGSFVAGSPLSLETTATTVLSSTSTWYLVTVTRNGGSLTIYLNGSQDGTAGGFTPTVSQTVALHMGRFRDGDTTNDLNAYAGPFRLGTFVPSANYVATMYNCESNPATFASYNFGAAPSSAKPFTFLLE